MIDTHRQIVRQRTAEGKSRGQIEIQSATQSEKQTDRQTDRKAYRQADRGNKVNKQTIRNEDSRLVSQSVRNTELETLRDSN